MKVTYFPNQPHCYAFGGFEVQMLAAYDAVKSHGGEIELLNPWRRAADFDIVHIWGFEISQFNNIMYSKKANKRVVVTDLLPDFTNLSVRLRFLASSYIYKVRILKELVRYVDWFIAINELEKSHIHKYYGFPESKIRIIPNIVSETYLDGAVVEEDLGIDDFVLCVGNVCQRKNQLNLVKACNQLGHSVLLVGNLMEGEARYGELVLSELKKNPKSKWIQGIRENSNTLKAAYQQCKLFALLSHLENQPISVLEALATNCRVLLSDRPFAHQSFYKNARKVDPTSVSQIQAGITQALSEPIMSSGELMTQCSKEHVGNLYMELYQQLG